MVASHELEGSLVTLVDSADDVGSGTGGAVDVLEEQLNHPCLGILGCCCHQECIMRSKREGEGARSAHAVD